VTGGLAHTDDVQAAYATAAEGLERYLWAEATDYYINPILATEEKIKNSSPYLSIDRFAGFSPEQRRSERRTVISENTELLWIQGVSLVTGKKTYLPAQVVSSKAESTYRHDGAREPVVRLCITTGLATWTDTSGARLRGAYEAIERDAYMIWWLNQLVVPRIPIGKLCESAPSLKLLIDTCTRYGLKVHALRLVTDAPAHVICVVVEDDSAVGPRYTFGLKAGRSLPSIIEAGALEALRARHTYRLYRAEGKIWDTATPVEKIGHRDRLYYWSVPDHAKNLVTLLSGKEIAPAKEVWEESTDEQHLERIVSWCRNAGYEYVSVNLGFSKSNPTPWKIEMAVIPELQPTYLNENLRQASGARLRDIPTRFGYTPRETPFLSAPHPFL
jgi:ribosomal protein S12 methylthiotransferase accessory factor